MKESHGKVYCDSHQLATLHYAFPFILRFLTLCSINLLYFGSSENVVPYHSHLCDSLVSSYARTSELSEFN
ncbi:hypothetical protein KIN20_032148 [Parelaphostrongylus tenuis]|uniref:Uncharacterized protein n=1 Tax=Parelaphostrongylus tenuis TaxID=148309 RepID=A0AAD5R6L3_PARTN|nr:hypothetical protein KIN20_032148 [Parelaphostrongylus tenuis]